MPATAPTPTTRGTPAGTYLRDGAFTKITFATNSTIAFWEDTLQPPGFDGGEPVSTTTMFNTTYETQQPQSLKKMSGGNVVAAYDPALLSDIVALINVRTTITFTFPDGHKWAFYGYLQKFEPQEIQRGQMPKANLTFQPTNQDAANLESGPVYS